MKIKFISFLPENWLHALGTTLFHSLWLGVILSLLAGIVIFTTRKTSALLRYNLLAACLGLFVIAILFIFYKALGKPIVPIQSDQIIFSETNLQHGNIQEPILDHAGLFFNLNKIFDLWNSYSYQIVLIWFLIICAKCIQFLVGLNGINHLRKNKTYAAGNLWDIKLVDLSRKMGVNQKIKVMQSGLAQVPMIIGHFKPLILIPLGLINGLSGAEVEAILAHELAHIKRKDYLINLLQSLIEIVFFFNPAVLWVSQLIKIEREHCCDDLAITCVNDRKNYVQALVICQEFKQRAPAYAMAITGKKSNLLHRASRMLFNTNSNLNKMEKTILTIALVSVVVCTAAFKSVSHAATAISTNEISSSIQVLQDTVKKTIKADNGKSGAQMEAEIDRKIKIEEKNSAEKGKVLKSNDLKQTRVDGKVAELDEQSKEDAELAKEDIKRAKEDKRFAIQDIKRAKQQAKIIRENHDGFSYESTDNSPVPPVPPTRSYGIVSTSSSAANVHIINGVGEVSTSETRNYTTENGISVPPTPPLPAQVALPAPPLPPVKLNSGFKSTIHSNGGEDITGNINKELKKDGIISATNKLSFRLSKDELVVNGVKQSDAILKKYKEKFLKNDNKVIAYSREVEHHNN